MNYITIGIGIAPCLFAIIVLILRLQGKDERFKKLVLMKERFGKTTASLIHYISYVVIPFIFGCILIYLGITGMSIIH